MCGIVGVAGNTNSDSGKVFRDMLIFDIIRGIDSTGVVNVPAFRKTNKATPVLMEKDIGLPNNLWEDKDSKIFTDRGKIKALGKVLIGHNRAATIGNVTVENAHPFNFGSVYGVHNGSLRTYSDLENYLEHDVDSMCLLDHISQHGVEDAWKNFLGAAALVWFDDKDQTLHFARNSERPLHYMWSKDKKVLFWASEPWMIQTAAARHKVDLLKNDKDKLVLGTFEVDTHYSFVVESNDIIFKEKVKMEKKPQATAITRTGGYSSTGTRSNYTVVGSNRKSRDKVKRRKGKQLDYGWGKTMKRAGKETRGLNLTLSQFVKETGTFLAKFDKKSPDYITVYPSTDIDLEKLQHALKIGNTRFYTISRMRYSERNGYTMYGVASAGIRPRIQVVDSGIPVVHRDPEDKPMSIENLFKKDDEDFNEEPKIFRSYKGVYVNRAAWMAPFNKSEAGCTCLWCGNPLDINEHEDMVFLSQQDALCAECSGDEDVAKNILQMNPNYDWPERKAADVG